MSEATTPGVNGPWPVLDAGERRVLGVLVEKAKTTPDAYPMSLNALLTGSNQKSNREPVMNLGEFDIEDALNRLKNRALVTRVTGSRVERWRHLLYESWHVGKMELAILAELLLRGPQTEGELRTRANRMEPIDDLDALRNYLRPLVERNLVVYLTPEDRRGAILSHGFHDRKELEHLMRQAAAAPASASLSPAPPAVAPAPVPREDQRIPALHAELEQVKQEVAGLRQQLGKADKQYADLLALLNQTRTDLDQLKKSLGA